MEAEDVCVRARTCVRDLPHGEDALEAAYDEMLDRQGLSFMDRKCIGGNNAQLQHNRLTTNRQILLPCSNVHVVHVRHHLRFGQRSLLVWGRRTYMCGYQQEEGITSGGSTYFMPSFADTTSANPVLP